MSRLLRAGIVQAKLRVSQPGDADEAEADRAAEQAITARHTPVLRRKCTCGGTCSNCQQDQEQAFIQSRSVGPLRGWAPSLQRAAAKDRFGDSNSVQESAHLPDSGSRLLVANDNALSLAPGQMRKTQFLELLQITACATADAVLESVGRNTRGCPYIKKWLGHYREQDAQHLTRAMHKYAPETMRAHSAHEAIALINRRVERAALSWARTGKVTGLPPELQAQVTGGGLRGLSDPGSTVMDFFSRGRRERKEEPSESGRVQTKSRDAAPGAHETGEVQGQLGSGRVLDAGVQTRMSAAFGYDFTGVRIHTDSQAGELSSQLNARAFTVGRDVAFADGEYQPGTLIGDGLIAHELAHVVQQDGGKSATSVARSAEPAVLESDADHSAVRAISALAGRATGALGRITANAGPLLRSGLRLQRCGKSERQKEIERLGDLQYGFMEEKRKKEEARLKKEAEEEAKKKGLAPPAAAPKVEIGDVIKKEEETHGLKGSPTTEWDTADQAKWNADAAQAWNSVVASVKGTELEPIAKGVKFEFNPKKALQDGFYAAQSDHTLIVGMSWVRMAKLDPKNVWENLAHEMAGHFQYGTTYASEIMDAALSKLSSADRKRFRGDEKKFFETYEYPETEIYASLWQRRYRVPVTGAERPSGGIHPDANIEKRLKTMLEVLHPEVAKAVLKELKRHVDANDQILQRDKDFFVAKVKEIFGYSL